MLSEQTDEWLSFSAVEIVQKAYKFSWMLETSLNSPFCFFSLSLDTHTRTHATIPPKGKRATSLAIYEVVLSNCPFMPLDSQKDNTLIFEVLFFFFFLDRWKGVKQVKAQHWVWSGGETARWRGTNGGECQDRKWQTSWTCHFCLWLNQSF